jgi:hypothetical protein
VPDNDSPPVSRGDVAPGSSTGSGPRPAGSVSGPAGSGSRPVGSGSRPAVLAVVCVLVVVQAGLLVGLGGVWVLELVRGQSRLPGATVFLALFALGVAAVLVLAVRGLWAGRRWARSPIMTWQVLLVVMSVGWLGVETALWAVGVLVSALVVGVGLVLPSVVAVTSERPGR